MTADLTAAEKVPPTIVRATLGWGNPDSPHTRCSLDVYGPGGRWADDGDDRRLPDVLADLGMFEGAQLLVVAVDRFSGATLDEIAAWLDPDGPDNPVAAAVKAETERCAALVDDLSEAEGLDGLMLHEAAAAIRDAKAGTDE